MVWTLLLLSITTWKTILRLNCFQMLVVSCCRRSLNFLQRYCTFQRNEPCSLPAIVEMIAAFMKKPVEEVALATAFNALKVFGLSQWLGAQPCQGITGAASWSALPACYLLYIAIIWLPFVRLNRCKFVGLIWMFSHGRVIPGFKSCGMWRCAVGWVVPGVLNDCGAFVLKVKQSERTELSWATGLAVWEERKEMKWDYNVTLIFWCMTTQKCARKEHQVW